MLPQFERTKRYLERIRKIYHGVPAEWCARHDYHDDVHSFFVHCYHVRDWIVTLNKIGVSAKDVDRYIDSQDCLRLCADLCNASKHCELIHKTRSQANPYISMTQHRGGMKPMNGQHLQILRSTFTIVAGTRFIDALELAEQCVSAWESYILTLRQRAVDQGLLKLET